jgi:hypothetical protein
VSWSSTTSTQYASTTYASGVSSVSLSKSLVIVSGPSGYYKHKRQTLLANWDMPSAYDMWGREGLRKRETTGTATREAERKVKDRQASGDSKERREKQSRMRQSGRDGSEDEKARRKGSISPTCTLVLIMRSHGSSVVPAGTGLVIGQER